MITAEGINTNALFTQKAHQQRGTSVTLSPVRTGPLTFNATRLLARQASPALIKDAAGVPMARAPFWNAAARHS